MDRGLWQKEIERRNALTEEKREERKKAEEARKWAALEAAQEKRKKSEWRKKQDARTSNKLTERRDSALFNALTKEERSMERGLRRDPAGRYVALAFNSIQVQHWCRAHDVNPLNIRAINDPQDVRGAGFDLIVVCFSDFGERNDTRFRDACQLVQSRAIAWRYPEQEQPIVVQGRVIGWATAKEKINEQRP